MASCCFFSKKRKDVEMINLAERKSSGVFVALAEINYILGTALSFPVDFNRALPSSMGLGVSLGWNYGDAVCAIGIGLQQLLSNETKHSGRTRVKGLLNVISGVQLFLLSYNPPLTLALGIPAGMTLAAPSFALAMGIDVVTAAIDYCTAHEEYYGLINSSKSKKTFEGENADGNNVEDDKSNVSSMKEGKNNSFSENDITAAREKYNAAKLNLAVKIASFVGMTLLAVSTFVSCPPVFFVGLALTAIVAIVYSGRNGCRLADCLMECFNIAPKNHEQQEEQSKERTL